MHLQANNRQDITPTARQAFLPMMEICMPLQGAAPVRDEVIRSSVVPRSGLFILCAATVTSPAGVRG